MKRIDFENGSVTSNILNAAIPMLVAQILNLLYNIVDRIYIARIPDVGTTALGAVGLCFPIIMIITAFSNLFGTGGAPIFSINRGRGDSKAADDIMNTSFTMLCASALILMAVGMLFARPLLVLFGASSEAMSYAYPYLMIYLLGSLPSMLASGMNPFINAQGYATIGMLSVAFVLVSQSLLTAAQKALIRTLLIIMAAMIFAIMVLVLFVSQWMTKPVEEMSSTITRIKNGETQLRVQPVGWSQELTTLGTEFNEMLDRMEVMAQEELQHKMLVERTEYKMLQAQINPHFLYNTLDTMSGIANAQNCPLVSGMCRSLSAIFRYSLNMTDELSTLQNEMAHVRNYLYVMDVRNGSAVAYDYQIDSDTLQDPMPRICIQPVVENALTHGLRNVRRKDKKLLIRSEHVGENLVITVRDNGAGMDAEAMNRLLEQNDMKRVETGVSIGILNVNARLKKLFGKEYGLHIESTVGEGTTVTITVPAVSENDTEHSDNGAE